MTFLRALSMLLLFSGILASSTLGQTNKASISGTVKDPQGAVVADADVTVTNNGTGISRKLKTNSDGVYEVPLLDAGTYSVSVSKSGFKTVKQDNVILQTSTETRADIELPVGEISNEVTITAEQQLVQTETSERANVITGREVTELPLSGRNFTQLATLTPGVVRSSNVGQGGGPEARAFNGGDPRAGNGGPGGSNENGSTESSRFNRSGGASISANGQRATNNNFSLDGVDNNEPQFGTIGVFPNPDAIAEFKVSTSVPPAEVGRASGAVVTVTTRSGGNEFSGSLYYYGQNSALNAYHPVLKTKLAEAIASNKPAAEIDGFRKPVQQIHEYGGTLGGPIIKNRTFFFFNFLGQHNNLPFPYNTTVPALRARNGDFTDFATKNGAGVITDGQIFNPFNGQPFANNIIPSSFISPVGQKYLNAFPNPTSTPFKPGGRLDCCGNGAPNYFTQRANTERIRGFGIKIDHRISDNNSLTGSFTDQPLKTTRANLFPGNIPTAGFGAGEERGNSRLVTISDVHTFSPTLLNEFRFGMSQIQISIFNCGVGGACGVSPTFAKDIGIPNSNDGSVEASGGALIGNFGTGFMEFTGDGGLFQAKSKNPYFADTMTFIRGKHIIKAGGEIRLRYLNTFDGGRTGALKGQFQYGDNGPATGVNLGCPVANRSGSFNAITGDGCYIRADGKPYGGTGNSLANILLDVPALFVSKGAIQGGSFNLRSQEYGFFVQDDWKVNDRLTLNVGLRYDVFTPFSEKDGRYSLYDPAQRKVVVASGGGDGIQKTDKNNFGPRIGVAYSLNKDKTMVLRGGYGLLYTLDGVDYPPGVRNAPFSNSVSFNQNGFNTGASATAFTLAGGPPTVPLNLNPATIPDNIAVFAVDTQQKVGLTHQFQVSFQYQFMKNYSVDIGYVGNRSRNLLYANNIGSGGTGESRNSAGQLMSNALIYTNGAKSQYDALQVKLQKRFSNSFQGQVSYTYGNTKDNSTGIFNGIGDQREGRSGPINPLDINADWGNSSLDTRQLLTGNIIVDLPFGKGKKFLDQGGAVDAVVGGWQFNAIVTGRTGYPFSVFCGGDGERARLQRPMLVGDPFSGTNSRVLLNRNAFNCDPNNTNLLRVTNAAGQVIKFGNLGRNTFRGQAIWDTSFSLFKNFSVTEKWKLQFGIELYNAFNRLNFTVPNNNTNNGDFGEIKNNASQGRVVQYRFKVIY